MTVDSILGAEDARLPAWLLGALGFADLRAEPGRALWLAAAAVTVSAALRAVCGYGQRVSLAKGSEGFVKGIRDALFEHIQSLPFEWHTAHQTGEMIQRCTSDVEVIRNFVCNQLVEVARTLFLMALYLSIMFSMNVRLSLIVALLRAHNGAQLLGVLPPHRLPLQGRGRGRGRAHDHGAGKPHRRARGARLRAGDL